MNPKRSAPRSKVAKIKDKEYTPITRILKEKNKEEIHKAAREKQFVMYKETFIRLTFQQKLCRPEGSGMMIKVVKGKNLQP